MLVHGPSKAGKSLLAASTPTPRLYLDVEAAARFLPLNSIEWDGKSAPPMPNGTWDTVVVPIREWTDLTNVIKWLQSGKHGFVSVSLDSVSELQNRYLEFVAGRGNVKIDQWGGALREVAGAIRDLRDLTMHKTNPVTAVVVTAMTKVEQDGRYVPYLQGQLKATIPYLLDITAFLDVVPGANGAETRQLYTRKTPRFLAGERVGGKLPPMLILPVVSGDTMAEVAERNITFAALIQAVYASHMAIAAPAVVDTTPSDFGAKAPFAPDDFVPTAT